jgi:glycosyltransferase involved in cell wall biosynthesis
LRHFAGHHIELARIIKAELSAAYDVRLYTDFEAANRIVAELRAQPICHGGLYVRSDDFRAANEQQRFVLTSSLRKIDLSLLSPRTIFVMHTVTIYQLAGLAEWYSGLPPAHRPKLFLQFQFQLEYGVVRESDWPVALEVARESADTLAQAGSVTFATNTDLLKDQLSRQLGHTWRLMPLPTRWPDQIKANPPTSGVVFGFYGGLRMEKGSRILAEALSSFTTRYLDTNFIVQAPPPENDETALQQLASIPHVEIVRTKFKTKDSYFEEFCRSHFILLPYDPANYAVRTSTVFIEALGLGRPVITTNGTWMAHQLRQRPEAGLVMASYSAGALFDCLEAARTAVLSQTWKNELDPAIISANSAKAFCAALKKAVQD